MSSERRLRVEQLYRERHPAHRVAFLAEACNGDEDLRSEVETLLEQSETSDKGV